MKIEDIINNIEKDLDLTPSPEVEKVAEEVDTSPETLVKLATYLRSFSDENNLIDDIARLAVLHDAVTATQILKGAK